MVNNIFDFTHEDFSKSCPAKQQFLKLTFNEPLSEEDFVTAVHRMPKHLHWSRSHSPSHARQQYRKLRDKFGFFQNGVEVKVS